MPRTAEEWAEIVRRAGRAGGLARARNLSPEKIREIAVKASKAAAKARTKKSPEQRSEIARTAARARWGKKNGSTDLKPTKL